MKWYHPAVMSRQKEKHKGPPTGRSFSKGGNAHQGTITRAGQGRNEVAPSPPLDPQSPARQDYELGVCPTEDVDHKNLWSGK